MIRSKVQYQKKISNWKINEKKKPKNVDSAWHFEYASSYPQSYYYTPVHALYISHMCSSFLLIKHVFTSILFLRLTDQRKQTHWYYIRFDGTFASTNHGESNTQHKTQCKRPLHILVFVFYIQTMYGECYETFSSMPLFVLYKNDS